MKGSKKEMRPGTWRLWVSAGKDPETGRYRYVTATFHGTKDEADRELHRMIINRETLASAPKAERFDAWLAEVFDGMEGDNSATTVHNYRKLAERSILPTLGKKKLEDIGVADLNALYRKLRKQGLAPATVRQVHAVIRRALHLALNEGRVKENVALRATPPRGSGSRVKAPSPEEVAKILEVMKADEAHSHLVNFYLLAALTGARRGELCGVRWSDIDIPNRILYIRRALIYVPGSTEADIPTKPPKEGLIRGHGHTVMEKSTKTDEPRFSKLDEAALQVVLDQMEALRQAAAKGGFTLVDDPWLFWNDTPTGAYPVHPDNVTRYFRTVCKGLGLSYTLHTLRHFTATQLIASGLDVRTVASQLGHSSPSVTLNVYAHAIAARSEEASATMVGILGLGRRG